MSSKADKNTLTAAEQVLNTTELLEHILSFLPMPKVLGKSRVSRNWKAVIDDSPALHKKLFLRHSGSQAEVLSADHWFSKPQDWPRNWSQTLSDEQNELFLSLPGKPVYTAPIELNPLVGWENQADLHVSHEMNTSHPKRFHPSLTGIEMISGKLNPAYVRYRFGLTSQTPQCNSSWRKMYLTSPPIADLAFAMPAMVSRHIDYMDHYFKFNVHAEHGITLGLLYDKLDEQMKTFSIKNVKFHAKRFKKGHPKSKRFIRRWGSKEHPMFVVKTLQDNDNNAL
jgi:hypothetical protein